MDAENDLPEIDVQTAKGWLAARDAILVDVREAEEYDFENVPGALLLPLSFLDPDTFPPLTERKVIVMCAAGKRSAAAQKQLVKHGLGNIYNMAGGMAAWTEAGLDVQGTKYEDTDFAI